MIRFRLMLALSCTFFLPSQPANAERAREVAVAVPWSLVPSEINGARTLDLRSSKSLEVGTASPRYVFRLQDDAQLANGKVFIPKGIELAWANNTHQIACEPIRVERHANFRCLLDSDGDGTLDFALVASGDQRASWRAMEHFEYLIGPFVAIEPVGTVSLKIPISITEIKVEPSQLKVGIFLKSALQKNRISVSLCASRQGYENVCTPPHYIELTGQRTEIDQFGLRMVAEIISDGSSTLTVTANSDEISL
jgi:hypothetical protein